MPIKFRCDYCRQLMGIAHSKAGSLVDCPTCGRTLRVPNQDGTVDPPPTPGVDLADDGLRRALDELAQIGQPDDEPAAGPRSFLPDPSSLVAKPGTPPSPTAAPAVVPSAKTIVAPVVKPSVQLVNSLALEPLPQHVVLDPPPPPRSPGGGGSPPVQSLSLAGASPDQILAGLANQHVPPRPAAVVESVPEKTQGYSLTWVVLVGFLCFAGGLAGGWGLCHNLMSKSIPGSSANGAAAVPIPAAMAKPAVKGRVTFRNAQSQLEPDVGAVVLLLPVKHKGQTKLASLGVRPNDDQESRQHATKTLAGQGGCLAVVDEDGSFRAELPQAGDYHLIVLSHFQGRPKDAGPDAAVLKTLEEFFERPEQLTGQLGFEVAEIKHKGSGTVIWDHTFGGK